MGVAATVAPKRAKGLGPYDQTRKLAQWVDLLGQPLSQKYVFKILQTVVPLETVKNIADMNKY